MRKFIRLWSGSLLVAVSLCGCANTMDIPNKKEDVIVDYMANIVLEHNNSTEYIIEEQPIKTLPPKVTPSPKATKAPEKTKSPEKTNKPSDDSSTKSPESTPVPSETTTDNPAVVLGVSGIGMKIKGYQIQDSYSSGDYFTLEPEEGKVLLMVNVTLTNKSSADKQLTLTADMVDYEIVVNDNDTYNPLLTVLDNDMLYLERNIAAGKSEDAILVFQVDKNTDIKKVNFKMENKKDKYAQVITKAK